MLAEIVRRLLQSVVVLLAVGLVAFSMFRFVGDPIDNMLGQERTDADIERLRGKLGLDQPFPVQYLRFLESTVKGEMGVSFRQGRPVADLFAERAPATLELALVSGILAIGFGIVFGVYTAISRGRARRKPPRWTVPAELAASFAIVGLAGGLATREGGIADRFALMVAPGLDWGWIIWALVLPLTVFLALRLILHPATRAPAIMTGSLIGVSLPTFLIGILLIYVFAVELKLLPSFGRGSTVDLGWWTTGLLTRSGWASIILPAITLGLYQMTLIMRLVRSEMLEVLRADYIRFARARGLRERAINFGHALKNTLVPVITVIGLQFGAIVAFAIITETVFQWPGLGLLFIDSVRFVDVPVMAAYLMMISVLFVFINLVVDLLYLVIDPRLRADRAAAAK